MRWLAIHLPNLPLDVFGPAGVAESPLAISVSRKGECILRCNPAAAACGVRRGLGVGAARALCAQLQVLPHRPVAEREALERLAAWSIRFSPQVSLAPPRSLLLDVAASLRLFGGARSLIARVEEGMGVLGYGCRLALTPTPIGALVLAVQGWAQDEGSGPVVVADRGCLATALGGLPLAALGLRPRELDDLGRMGLVLVSDLLSLPRRGLRERLGPKRVDWLGRLLGELPDPRPWFSPPTVYAGGIELPGEVELTESLIFPCRRLLLELEGFLIGRRSGARRLDWRLAHADLEDTCFSIGAARLRWGANAWLELLRGRLERLELQAPVREVHLQAHDISALDLGAAEVSPDLFPDLTQPGQAPDQSILERLRARLGSDAVRGIALVADHRPECAWRWCEPGQASVGIPRADRPLWLLPEPRPLETREGRPWLDGPLDLGQERERIDTGWWDDLEIARDYFVVTTPRGERFWVYREIKGPRDWYLHGVFG